MLLQERTIVLSHPQVALHLRQVLEGSAYSLRALLDRGYEPVIMFRPRDDGGWGIQDESGNPIRSRADLCERLNILNQWGQPRHQAQRTEAEFAPTGGAVPDAAIDAAYAESGRTT